MISEGGTERGHSITVARSRRPDGPFQPAPANPILTMRGLAGPVQNTGHGDLVEPEDGSWAMVFLGVRSVGGSPTWHGLGRETFAADVEWHDGWPTPTTPIEPTIPRSEMLNLRFTNERLGPEWVTPSAGSLDFAHPTPDGLTLEHRGGHHARDLQLLQRLRHQRAHIRSSMHLGAMGAGGLVIRIDDRHAYSIEAANGVVSVNAQIGDLQSVVASAPLYSDDVNLGIDVDDATERRFIQTSDTIVFTYADRAASPVELARLDGRYLTSEVSGGFTGRMFGFIARSGNVTVRTLTYDGLDLD